MLLWQRFLKNPRVLLEDYFSKGQSTEEALLSLSKHWLGSSFTIIFNGDNYSQDWVIEAKKRGLPNLRTTAEALAILNDSSRTAFLSELKILNVDELKMRYNAFLEKYVTCRQIEFNSLTQIISQHVIPSALEYKKQLLETMRFSKKMEMSFEVEKLICADVNSLLEELSAARAKLEKVQESFSHDEQANAQVIGAELVPLSETIGEICNRLEGIIPAKNWSLPTYLDLLFVR